MSASALIDDLAEFFSLSATNAERLPERLRDALTVKTVLVDIAEEALAAGRTVVVAGTAGSGKTHLIDGLRSRATNVVQDLSTVQEQWPLLFTRGQALVAGNEGAFLLGANEGHPGFAEVVHTLHQIQQGEHADGGNLTVIDAAAYDPVASGAVTEMISNALVREFVQDRADPLRREAWKMLGCEVVQRRLTGVLDVASSAAGIEGFTFRQLWQFVADLASKGEDVSGIWFWRLFNGPSSVAARVRETLCPADFALPHIAGRLWYRDLRNVRSAFLPESHGVLKALLSKPPGTVPFDLLKLLAAFGLQDSPLDHVADRREDTWSKVCFGADVRRLIRHINYYLHYGLLNLQQEDHLHLWTQTDTERRETKPRIQVSLGLVDPDKFEIRRNRIAANTAVSPDLLSGRRVILALVGTPVVLDVTKDLVDGIDHVRSHRILDRKDVEFDWRLLNFLAGVAKHQNTTDTMHIAHFDFRSRVGDLSTWDLADGLVVKR